MPDTRYKGRFLGGKLLDFRLQRLVGRQLGNAFLLEIPGGCVRYDKVALMLFPIGAACLIGFLLFQPVPHITGLSIGKHLFLQLLFLADCRFNGLQLGAAALQVRIGRYKGCVQFLRGKAVLLHSGNGSRHLFEVVDSRSTVIADAFSLGSFCGTVNHFLNGTCRGDFLRFPSPCAVCFCGVVFGYGDSLFGGSVGVLLQKGENGSTVKIISQLSGGNGLRPVRGEVGKPSPAFFHGHTLPEIEIKKEIDIELEKEGELKGQAPAHSYGRYENVFLTDTELSELQAELPEKWAYYIERLSGYIASTGKKYKNHAATIHRWAADDTAKAAPKQGIPEYTCKEGESL